MFISFTKSKAVQVQQEKIGPTLHLDRNIPKCISVSCISSSLISLRTSKYSAAFTTDVRYWSLPFGDLVDTYINALNFALKSSEIPQILSELGDILSDKINPPVILKNGILLTSTYNS